MTIRKPKNWGQIKPPAGYAVDWSDPISKGLVGCWLFNEGAGKTLYDLAQKNHGSFINSPTWSPGKLGPAVSFVAASSQYVTTGNVPANWANANDFSLYVRFRSTSISASQALLSERNAGNGSVLYLASSKLTFWNSKALASPNTLLSNTSYDALITHPANGTITMYTNGVSVATESSPGTMTSSSNFDIGRFDNSNYFGGLIEVARLYKRALTGGEASRLYSEPFAGIMTPRRRFWNSPAIGIAFDVAGNSGDQAAASSYSGNASWNGTNRMLAVDVSMLGPGVTVSTMTYGGANCTFIGAQSTVTSFGRVEQWRICSSDSGAPAAGANTLAITLSGSLEFAAEWASYTGVHQTSPTEGFNSAQATNAGSATDASVAVTSIADNCWVHAAVVANDTSITANQTTRNNISGTLGSGANEDNNAPITPAGATTMSYSGMGITTTWAIAGYAIRPLAASGSGFLSSYFYDMIQAA